MTLYGFKNKLKSVCKKLGIFDFVRTVYHKSFVFRHIKCERGKKKRANGYDDKRFAELKKYKDIHHGERAFIVCTGPSLTPEDLNTIKGEYSFAVNTACDLFTSTDWRPTYYVVQDYEVFSYIQNKVADIAKERPVFISDFIAEFFGDLPNHIQFPLELYDHVDGHYYDQSDSDRVSHKEKKYYTEFSGDAYAIVNDGGTVTYSAMQLAVYMGFKEIYLIGCDCDYSGDKQHMVDYGPRKTESNSVKYMISSYKVAKDYADAHGIKICNATRGGKLEVFERVDFDSLFENKQ